MFPEIPEILRMVKAGEIDIEQALQWIGQHIEQAAQGTMLKDHFASTAVIAVVSDGTIPIGTAMTVMGGKPPAHASADDVPNQVKILNWWHTAEARVRYLKAEAMMAARIL